MNYPTLKEVQAVTGKMRRHVGAIDYAVEAYTVETVHVRYVRYGKTVHVRYVRYGKTVFTIWAESLERVEAHWESFLVQFNALAPKVDSFVRVSTGYNRDYRAKVLKVSPTRALCVWRYRHGGKSAPRWFPLRNISW